MATPSASGPVSKISLSGNSLVNALLEGSKWGSGLPGSATTITYSLPTSNNFYIRNYGGVAYSEPFTGFSALSSAQIPAVQNAMAAWANVANIQWQAVAESSSQVGDVRIAFSQAVGLNTNNSAWGYAYYLSGGSSYPEQGDIWIDSSYQSSSFAQGGYDFMALVHELGHALGFKHPFEAPTTLPIQYDSWQYSLMSYNEPNLNWGNVLPSTPMLLDIQAMQYLYGANTSYHAGNDVYQFTPSQLVVETIWDAGGSNTFDASAFSAPVTISLKEGSYSSLGLQSNVAIAYGTKIQNALGGADHDTIVGNAFGNQISTGAGNDSITLGGGHDLVDGGVGSNTVVFSSSLASYQFVRDGDSLRVLGPNNSRAILTGVQNLSFSDGTVAVSDLASHAPVNASSVRTGIVEIYVAMVGRAPELEGFHFWEDAALAGNRSTLDLANIMFTLPIVQAVYPNSADETSFINSIYQFVVGRAADSEGLAFWQNQLSSGSATRGGLIVDLVNVALNTADGTPGKAFLVNRIAAAQATMELQEAAAQSIAPDTIAQTFTSINSDPASVSSGLTSLKGLLANSFNNLANEATITTTGVMLDGHSILWIG